MTSGRLVMESRQLVCVGSNKEKSGICKSPFCQLINTLNQSTKGFEKVAVWRWKQRKMKKFV
jgi:hypothetical protein